MFHRFRKPKSLWGWALVVSVATALLILVANELAIVVTSRRLEARLAAIRADGKPTTFAELQGPPVPDERNAAVPLSRAAKRADLMFTGYVGAFGPSALMIETDVLGTAALAATAETDSTYEADLKKADSLPDYCSVTELTEPEPTALYADAAVFRNLYRVEWVRSRRRRHEDRPVEAAELMLRLIRLSNKRMQNEPSLVPYSVSSGARDAALSELNRTLQNFRLPPQIHAAIESVLEDEDALRSAHRKAIESQRVLDLQMHAKGALQFMNNHFFQAWANTDKLRYIDDVDRMLRVVHGPRADVKELDLEVANSIGPGVRIGRALWPGTASSWVLKVAWRRQCWDGSLARTRCLRVVNAVRRQGLKNPKLEDLGLPKFATTDPFNGEPLRLVVKSDGVLVYSVNEDLVDNGGDIYKAGLPSDRGYGPEPTASAASAGKK